MILAKYEEENGVTRVDIPDTVIYIRRYAFAGYKSIQEIKMPESVMGIGRKAFQNCTALKSITFSTV